MGERNKCTQAVILTVREQGENNRNICALSPDLGIFNALLYGGPKNRLRSLVQPFNCGNIWLYEDEVKHSRKITDFDSKEFHPSFRDDIYKIYAANLAGELVLKTKCAGENSRSFTLLRAFLNGIDASSEEEARLGTIRFLWRYLALLGIQPDPHECAECGKNLLLENSRSYYSEYSSAFICSDCCHSYRDSHESSSRILETDSTALNYLNAINELTPGSVRRMKLSADSAYKMKRVVFHILENSAGTLLNTLRTGEGIL
ncbi:DNA repair protein RecO [Treponema sp.]|uniref:DNA repair protein RecO n=1 Tax=Treponema sp. TaxID=166 RepID=UPI0025DEE479|nr:DNA repair protein RecO [Treponema sp.]MCR5218752.1 DNA repair protein RecO [Treponema sp.]